MSVLDLLRKREVEKKEKGILSYETIVKRLAANEPLELEDVEPVLEAAGKTSTDLTNAVSNRQRRDKQREVIAGAAKAYEAKLDAEKKIKAADAELEQARQRHAAAVYPLIQVVQAHISHAIQAQVAERELYEGCTCPVLRGRQQRNHQQASQLNPQLVAANQSLRDQRSNLSFAQSRGETENAKTYGHRVACIEAELATLREQEAKLSAEGNEIYRAMVAY